MSTAEQPTQHMLSIGALSQATGVPVATLRTWEKRYGFPSPVRRASGHRRYSPELVPRIRLVRAAIERGSRPSVTVAAPLSELRRLAGETGRPQPPTPWEAGSAVEEVEKWLELVRRFDGDALGRSFRASWQREGALRFLFGGIVPFLREVGERWARSDLGVMHEHFASEQVRDFLAAAWRPQSDSARGPGVLCATLPGEHHTLALHVAGVVLTIAGCRILLLGPDTPPAELAAAAFSGDCGAVLIGSSSGADPGEVALHLGEVRRLVPPRIPIVVGGTASDPGVEGVRWLEHLEGIVDWARELVQP